MKKLMYSALIILFLYVFGQIIEPFEYAAEPILPIDHIKRAIVVGATSGMGRQTAKLLARNGYDVGLVGRRKHLLDSLQREVPTKTYAKRIDVSRVDSAKKKLETLIKEMGGLDLMLVSVSCLGDVGCAPRSSKLSWHLVKKFLDVDTRGFWVCAQVGIDHFEKQKSGHLIGISSVDGLFGSANSPHYSGAKAFVSKYLDGIRNRVIKKELPIFVTEIIPGPVNVERQNYDKIPGIYWTTDKHEAAVQIYEAIDKKKKYAYITKRWRLIGFLMQVLPDWLLRRLKL